MATHAWSVLAAAEGAGWEEEPAVTGTLEAEGLATWAEILDPAALSLFVAESTWMSLSEEETTVNCWFPNETLSPFWIPPFPLTAMWLLPLGTTTLD
jgi:hypothetical protein